MSSFDTARPTCMYCGTTTMVRCGDELSPFWACRSCGSGTAIEYVAPKKEGNEK